MFPKNASIWLFVQPVRMVSSELMLEYVSTASMRPRAWWVLLLHSKRLRRARGRLNSKTLGLPKNTKDSFTPIVPPL